MLGFTEEITSQWFKLNQEDLISKYTWLGNDLTTTQFIQRFIYWKVQNVNKFVLLVLRKKIYFYYHII